MTLAFTLWPSLIPPPLTTAKPSTTRPSAELQLTYCISYQLGFRCFNENHSVSLRTVGLPDQSCSPHLSFSGLGVFKGLFRNWAKWRTCKTCRGHASSLVAVTSLERPWEMPAFIYSSLFWPCQGLQIHKIERIHLESINLHKIKVYILFIVRCLS